MHIPELYTAITKESLIIVEPDMLREISDAHQVECWIFLHVRTTKQFFHRRKSLEAKMGQGYRKKLNNSYRVGEE